MSFGKKTGRSAFFAVNGTEVVRLNESPVNRSELACIGRSVAIRSGGIFLCNADLFVSHSGAILCRLYGLFDEAGISPRAEGVIRQCASVLQSWTYKQLDDIAALYTYETEGQAALVIDILVRGGKVNYSDKNKLNASLDKTLSSGSFVIEASGAAYAGRAVRDFSRNFCYFRGIDPDEMAEFILELETCNGVVAVVQGSRLGILYAPPGTRPPITLFYFQVSGVHADLCINPDRTHHDLEQAGFSPLSANDLLDFLLQFADREQTRVPDGGGVVETLYMLPEPLFERAQDLKEQIAQFSRSL